MKIVELMKVKGIDDVDVALSEYGFVKIKDQIRFGIYNCEFTKSLSDDSKNFIMRNLDKFVEAYEFCIESEVLNPVKKNNNRIMKELINAVTKYPEDARYLFLYSFCYAKNLGMQDVETIEFIDRVLFKANYIKDKGTIVKKYNAPKFVGGLDKVFVEQFILNDFDLDATWKYLKKIAVQDARFYQCNDKSYNIWYPKKKSVEKIREKIRDHLKYGGKMSIKLEKNFKCFIPMETEKREEGVFTKLIVEKAKDSDKKEYFLVGTASNTKVDREDERMTSSFIQKMTNTAKGLTIFADHRHTIENAIGTIVDSWGDDNTFNIKAKLENPEENVLVKNILSKIASGIKIGFSVYGTILEAARVWDKVLERDIYEMSDGILEEVSVTAWPAAYDTWATAVSKSFREGKEKSKGDETSFEKVLAHNSKVEASEPSWGDVDKTSIPRSGHADMGEAGKKSTWKYPHHWVKNGKKGEDGIFVSGDMYLHKGGLNAAWAAAQGARSGQKASPAVIAHLQRHRTALGIGKMIDALSDVNEIMDRVFDSENILSGHQDKIVNLLTDYKKELNESANGKVTVKEKIDGATEVTKKFTEKTVALIVEMFGSEESSNEKE